MKNRKTKIEIYSIVYCLFSFVGIINFCVWARMADRMRDKKLKRISIADGIICFALIIVSSVISEFKSLKIVSEILIGIAAFLVVVPIFMIFWFRKEYVRRMVLIEEVKENNINVEKLDMHEYEQISLNDVPQLVESSQKLYGEKGKAVLRSIKFKEMEKERAKLQVKLEEERKKNLEAEEKERLRKEKFEIEREKTRIEMEMLKVERAKAEAERAKAEAERATAEKIKAETVKTKEESGEAETEIVKNKNNMTAKKIDVNVCSEQELSIIPGIGIILSKKAISIREEKGEFQSVDEFIELVGIRTANIELVRPYLECAVLQNDSKELKKKQGRKIDL